MTAEFSVDISIKERGRGKANRIYSVDRDLSGQLTLERFLEELKATHIATALNVLREEQRDGFDKKPRIVVDNTPDKNINDVKAVGKIQFFSRQNVLAQIVTMYDEIFSRSIVDTGIYIRSNVVLVNGRVVATSRSELAQWVKSQKNIGGLGADTIVTFVNATPYARKLERFGYSKISRGKSKGDTRQNRRFGKDRKTNKAFEKPNGAYWLASRAIKSKFKAVTSFVRFRYLTGKDFNISFPGRKFMNSFADDGRPYLYPAIVVQFSNRGVNSRSGGLIQ